MAAANAANPTGTPVVSASSAAFLLATTITTAVEERLTQALSVGQMDDWTREALSTLLRRLHTFDATIEAIAG